MKKKKKKKRRRRNRRGRGGEGIRRRLSDVFCIIFFTSKTWWKIKEFLSLLIHPSLHSSFLPPFFSRLCMSQNFFLSVFLVSFLASPPRFSQNTKFLKLYHTKTRCLPEIHHINTSLNIYKFTCLYLYFHTSTPTRPSSKHAKTNLHKHSSL